ncbi:IS3 family transposase [Neobacillus drentensis]|uniref:IS3 family transposase n=1 Tax=Neobacillus drentensis TaxID=220684 RepID=UPI003B585AD1
MYFKPSAVIKIKRIRKKRKRHGHTPSVIQPNRPSFFSHLKTEKLYIEQCKSEVEIRQAIEDYIYHYNYKRIQKKFNQRAPIEYRHALAA